MRITVKLTLNKQNPPAHAKAAEATTEIINELQFPLTEKLSDLPR